jgi:hypothetical protein
MFDPEAAIYPFPPKPVPLSRMKSSFTARRSNVFSKSAMR